MSNPITVKIEGLEELSQKMQEFAPKVMRKGVRDALRAGAEVLRQEIKQRAPVLADPDKSKHRIPGFLRDHIGTKLSIRAKSDRGDAKVGPVKAAYWGLFAEFGTKNQPARPFMRPAFESAKQTALDAFISKLREAFDSGGE